MASKLENSTTPTSPFVFPSGNSKLVPDPSKFFSPNLILSAPLPTSSFFANFVIDNGDQPTFIHPYLIKLSLSSVTICYPSLTSSPSCISQNFTPDFTVSTSQSSRHIVSSFSDLTVAVDLSSVLRCDFAKGSPYITFQVSQPLSFSFSTKSEIKSHSSSSPKKHKFELKSKQIWVLYSSSEIKLKKQDDTHFITSKLFSGVIRIACIPQEKPEISEEILDSYSTCYPTSGEAIFSAPFSLGYKWETKGWGELLMLAHPLHLKLLSVYNCGIKVLNNFKYKSINGTLVGVVGNFWKMRVENIPISWHSRRGIPEENHPEIVSALLKDVGALDLTSSISTTHVMHYGMQISRAARFALIAEEVNCINVIPAIKMFLKNAIQPWLEGTFEKNGFVYDDLWGGIISKQGLENPEADYGFGLYNNHLYALGYFVFSIAVLAKLDFEWGKKFKPQAYALVASYMNLGRKEDSKNARLRSFDAYDLHSWAKHLKEPFHHQSESCIFIHAYYAAALLGKVYGDDHLLALGSTLASFEIEGAKTWKHVKEGGVYDSVFCKNNKFVGIVYDSKREDKLWFTSAGIKECRVGIEILPLMPVLSEILFSDVEFVKEVVDWVSPALARKEATDGWKGYVYALEAIVDGKNTLKKIKNLKGFDEANSLSNLLWWVHSIIWKQKMCSWCNKEANDCWFCGYCS